MDEPDFFTKTGHFLQWFKSIPGATFHENIELADLRYREAGRGLVATAYIPPGFVLFTVPRSHILNLTTSDLPRLLGNIFNEKCTPPVHVTSRDGGHGSPSSGSGNQNGNAGSQRNPWMLLVLVLIYEYSRGHESPWKGYLDILPDCFDTPLFWTEDELAELQASMLPARIGKVDSDKMIQSQVIPVLEEHRDIFFPKDAQTLDKTELLNLAHRMGSLIMAFAFDVETDKDSQAQSDEEDGWVEDIGTITQPGLVPMADMMNADAEFNAIVSYDDAALTVTTIRAIGAGEEILNNYGPNPNSELLRRYGYVTSKHSRYDVVEISWEFVQKQIQNYLGLMDEFMKRGLSFMNQDDIEETIVVERDTNEPGPDGVFRGDAAIRDPPPELENHITSMLKGLRKVSATVIPDKRKREEICKVVMKQVLQTRLSEYPTTLEEDRELLLKTELTRRHRMTIVVRAGEKQVLHEAIECLSNKANSEDPERDAKRLRASNDG